MNHFLLSLNCYKAEGRGQQKSTRTETKKEEVKKKVNEEPHLSVRKLGASVIAAEFCIPLFFFNILGA